MQQHVVFHASVHNEPAALPRILLTCSRRRLRVRALTFLDSGQGEAAALRLELQCDDAQARELLTQLRRIVEIADVRREPQSRDGVGAPVPDAALA